MGNAVAQLILVGIEMIVSPVPLAALIAILLSARAKTNAAIFTATAVTASVVVIGVSALTAEEGTGRTDRAGHSSQFVFATVFGLAFVALAAVSWRSRPRPGTVAAMPSWMAQIDTMNGAKTAVLSLLLTVPNAKNLPLELHAGAVVAGAHAPAGQAALIVLGVAVLGGAGLIALSVLAAVPSKRVSAALGVVKDELIRHNAAIMTVLFLLLAGLQVSHLVTALTV
ncbi:GAP family protein [Rhodococcus sp. ACT016]|uniref:GAP family protein n=1 Tax=Rhodococcus sp. ACT016 TaxID=3134808 RepID=UPI003D293EB0